jgi:hypothetical protein
LAQRFLKQFDEPLSIMRTDFPRFFFSAIALMITTSLSYAQSSDSSIAAIVDAGTKGRIWVKSRTSRQWEINPKNWQLCEGDSVKTDKLCSATIFYNNGQTILLAPRKSHRVTLQRTKRLQSELASVINWWFGQEKPLPQGASRGLDQPPDLIYPRYGKILSAQPTFVWLASAPGTEYRLQLFDANDELVWETVQPDTMLNYPRQAPALLDSADYQVEISRKYKNEAETYGDFSMATANERSQMAAWLKEIQNTYKSNEPSAVTVDVVYAAALMQEEFFTDAILVLQLALKKQPNNRAIRTMLAQIYAQVGPTVLIKPMLQ